MTTKTEAKRTPGEWKHGQYSNDGSGVHIFPEKGGFNICVLPDLRNKFGVGEYNQEANARFICLAVNSHDALVDCVENYLKAHDSTMSNLGVKKWLDDKGIPAMRAALELAKGE